ncbi:glycosyltransferase [Advenella sp. FME57]|uniref:glycosyltransferase n=1 Tax=Advenella sp. FME57 TaxID=2742604 RepID=UPI0018689D37|nr:glycosyltransferase [Advenella sp. FME57]
MTIDYSVVLNLHNEAPYLKRTLRSLAHAAEFARHKGLTSELILVLDSADEATREWVEKANYSEFDSYKVLHVSNRSLGLSRNDGIAAAGGEYVTTADADDLVSYNFFVQMHQALLAHGPNTIICPEHVCSFGDRTYWGQYTSSEDVTNIMLFGANSYVSRIGCHRSVFDNLQFVDARGGMKAFEDWHFNCEAVAAGYRFDVASDTILFYRQRRNSIMTTSHGRIIPFSRLFMPSVFVQRCADDYRRIDGRKWFDGFNSERMRQRLLASDVILESFAAANYIEPKIDLELVRRLNVGSSKGGPLSPGCAYYEAVKDLDDTQFTDVVLFPFVSKGGGEKYILDVVKTLRKLDPAKRVLILCGEKYKQHALHLLPEQCTFIDLYDICSRWQLSDIHIITLRIIQAVAGASMLHIKSCPYAFSFFERFSAELTNQAVFYYFSNAVYPDRGVNFTDGSSLYFISEFAPNLTHIVSDQPASIRYAEQRLDIDGLKRETLFAKCASDLLPDNLKQFSPVKRLLWASRLDYEKRPELIPFIAARLLEFDPDIVLDVYGQSVFVENGNQLATIPNVAYKGGFAKFADLHAAGYDALIYTSRFDGLPNIVLEAMAEGLLVIAPNVGGIGEIVYHDKTGLLLDNDFDDATMADRYLDAIRQLYDNSLDVDQLRKDALSLVLERHSEQAYMTRVKEIFHLADGSHE